MHIDGWLPIIVVVVGAVIVFDLWRGFGQDDTLGRPWPYANRGESPALFWAFQLLRVACLVTLLVIAAFMLSSRH